jgi:cytoskeletal protein RodZ
VPAAAPAPFRPRKKGGTQTRRFLEILNTPIAVLVVLVVVVVVNASLYFGHFFPADKSPASSPSPALRTESTSAPKRTTLERTDHEATEERVRPATTPGAKATSTATSTSTATATASP